MRIAVDIDNVVEDWQNSWADEYQLWFDRELDLALMGQWDAMTAATHFESGTEFWTWFNRAGLWDNLAPVPGALGALAWMQDHELVRFLFVTARPDSGVQASRRLAGRWKTTVEFLNDTSKHLAKADIWIDDSPHVLENLHAHHRPAIRLERPWNEGAPATFSAATWPEIIDILKELM